MRTVVVFWLFKLASYLPALVTGLSAFFFLNKGEVLPAAILTTCSIALALLAIMYPEQPTS